MKMRPPLLSHRLACLLWGSFWISVTVASQGPAPAAAPKPTPSAGSRSLAPFIRRFTDDWRDVSKFYDLPCSEERFDRLTRLDHEWQQNLKGVDFNQLDQQGRIDYVLLRTKLASDLEHLELDRQRLAQMEPLLPFRRPLQRLEEARWHETPVNPPAAAQLVAAIPDQLKALRARIEKGMKKGDSSDQGKGQPAGKESKSVEPLKVTPVVANRTAGVVDALRDTLTTWFNFYDGFQPDFTWWLKKPYEDANKALDDYARFLRQDVAGLKGKDDDPLVGDPIGAKALAADLTAEMIPYTPKQLIAFAEHQFRWCEEQMRKASREMGLGEDWKAALATAKADYVPPGDQEELVASLSRQAIRFVREHDLVTVPPLCEETWRLTMSSPQTQKVLPYAAYGGQNIMVAYANEEMKTEDKLMAMRGNNRHFTRIVVAHELIPGHHLQGFMAERQRAYRSIFRTPFLVEGWAFYWELRLWDLGYAQTPKDRIGMLFWRMHRCARIIVSLKYHLSQMTPEQMVDFLVHRVGHERSGATSEVRRYIGNGYSPLYQCSYMLGGFQLLALHDQLVRSGRMTDRQFNDTVLSYNAIPIEMIRAGMLNLPLTPDTRPDWKFIRELPPDE